MALKLTRIEADTHAACGLDFTTDPATAPRTAANTNPDTAPAPAPRAGKASRRTVTTAAGSLPPALFHLARTATPTTLREAAEALRREADLLDFHAAEIDREARAATRRRQRRIDFAEALDAMRQAVADGVAAEIAATTIAAARSIDPLVLLQAHRADRRRATKGERAERDAALYRLFCRGYTDKQLAKRASLSPSRVREIIIAQRKIHET